MPKNKVSDLITDQEIAFACLVLSGTMTDRDAAQAVGLNPDTAAYTKSKPRVRAYMLEHRAAMQQQLLDQESERRRRLEQRREQVLDRLWEIAKLSPEMTRGSITGQVKAISMIVAIEGLIPDRRAGSAENKSAPPLPRAEIYPAAWPGRQQEENIDAQPDPAHAEEEPGLAQPETTPNSVGDAPPPPPMPPSPAHDLSESGIANSFSSSETTPSTSHVPAFVAAADTRVPFSIKKNRFGLRR
ncbi:MAG: hypothetical protein QOH35_2581 [Acidobacteriaceae bacterium]|nr:hypothetical protein [Acidobacteriaceae bacterium]